MADPPKKKTKLPPVDATPQPTKKKLPQPVVVPETLYVRFQVCPGESVDSAIRATADLKWEVRQFAPTYLDGERLEKAAVGMYQDSGTIAADEVVQVPIPMSTFSGTHPVYVSIAWDASDSEKPIWSDYLVQFADFDDAEHPLYRLVALGYVMPFRDDHATTKAFSTKSSPPGRTRALHGASAIEEQAILQFQADHGRTFDGALESKGWAALKKETGG